MTDGMAVIGYAAMVLVALAAVFLSIASGLAVLQVIQLIKKVRIAIRREQPKVAKLRQIQIDRNTARTSIGG